MKKGNGGGKKGARHKSFPERLGESSPYDRGKCPNKKRKKIEPPAGGGSAALEEGPTRTGRSGGPAAPFL